MTSNFYDWISHLTQTTVNSARPAPDPSRVWMVTGCSSGFGLELVRALLDRGERVIATTRDGRLDVAAAKDRLTVLPLDLNIPASIESCASKAMSTHGRLDVLINNAGYGYLGGIEEAEEGEIRAQFETNFFGTLNLTRMLLPMMRAQRAGFIVNMSSVGGFVSGKGAGIYCASKFALEGLSEALAAELEPLGIRVMIVEPGAFRTDFINRSLRMAPSVIPDYAALALQQRAIMASDGKQAGDPRAAALAVIDVVLNPVAPLRLVLGAAGLDEARAKLVQLSADFEAWAALSTSVDYGD